MGIGNYPSLSNPIDFLTVGGNISLYPTTDASTRGVNGRTNTGIFTVNANYGSDSGPNIEFYGKDHSTRSGEIAFCAYGKPTTLSSVAYAFNRFDVSSSSWKSIMSIKHNGSVDLCGTFRAKEVVVETGWCDYVFKDNYDLWSLDDVELYIKNKKHLPGIPSAKDIEANGAAVGEMTSKLLLKVEELTLYMIDMKKENDALKARVAVLEGDAR